jgi:N-acetylmuramoyl-L-alanine amidase
MSMRFFIVRLRTVLTVVGLFLLLFILLLFGDHTVQTASDAVFSSLPLLILDAGHGGQDGGAVAADATNEKDINLSLTLKLDALLRSLGFQTLLTRTDDSLHETPEAATMRERKIGDLRYRLQLTQEHPDCILISIHQNQFSDPKYDGVQVFYSGNHPQSEELAQCLQDAIVRTLQPDNKRQIKQSGEEIFLLSQAKVPAIMVECGFMSNPKELQKLKDEKYQKQLAAAILNGLLDYFKNRT